MTVPCLNCSCRHFLCHSLCSKYKEFRRHMDSVEAAKTAEEPIRDYERQTIRKRERKNFLSYNKRGRSRY